LLAYIAHAYASREYIVDTVAALEWTVNGHVIYKDTVYECSAHTQPALNSLLVPHIAAEEDGKWKSTSSYVAQAKELWTVYEACGNYKTTVCACPSPLSSNRYCLSTNIFVFLSNIVWIHAYWLLGNIYP
jgi:hypothetical protein